MALTMLDKTSDCADMSAWPPAISGAVECRGLTATFEAIAGLLRPVADVPTTRAFSRIFVGTSIRSVSKFGTNFDRRNRGY